MKKVAFTALVFIFLAPSLSQAEPIARFAEVHHDFGSVSDSEKVDYVFGLSNPGDSDLVIEKIVATSGHAKAVANPTRLKPGEKGSIDMSVDLRGMRGIYSKSVNVYTNDPITPVTELSVKITISDRIPVSDYNASEIFAGRCKECHVEQGMGKMGWALFKADCFMCHNAGKNSSLTAMSRKPAEHVERAIRDGIPHSLMPGFAAKNGGPFDEIEIRSLMELITSH
jgi:hypothetical protein